MKYFFLFFFNWSFARHIDRVHKIKKINFKRKCEYLFGCWEGFAYFFFNFMFICHAGLVCVKMISCVELHHTRPSTFTFIHSQIFILFFFSGIAVRQFINDSPGKCLWCGGTEGLQLRVNSNLSEDSSLDPRCQATQKFIMIPLLLRKLLRGVWNDIEKS